MEKHREVAYVLLRFTYGMIFFFYGINKFGMGLGSFVNGTNQQFAGKLPAFLVTSFAYLIPFVEIIVGALIIAGLLTRLALTLSGLLMIGLTFGMVMAGQPQFVAFNLIYAVINFVLLWSVDLNLCSLDTLFMRKKPVGFTT